MPRRGQRHVQFACAKGQQCTAKSKRSGKRCRNYACQDRETCRMHGGTSKRGCEHWNYKTGEHSKVVRKAMKQFNSLLQRPMQVRIALYPEGFMETMATPWPERWFVIVDLCDWPYGIPLREQERVLRTIRREISTRLREVREEMSGKPSEE
jgi:hypothetical protein